MRKPEQRLWDRMKYGLKDRIYLERVENVVNPGRPDVDVMMNGVMLPIELKAIATWPRGNNTPVLGKARGLNKNQLNWWLQWRRWGGRGFILVGIEQELFSVTSEFSDQINSFTSEHFKSRRITWAEFLIQIKRESQCVLRP